MRPTRTITRTGDRRAGREAGKPFLFLVLQCDRPLSSGARFSIAGADAVTIGRGDELSAERSDRSLRLEVPDRRMSSSHVRLERVLGEWVAEDQGSKNGTFIDGRKVLHEPLADGALLELGYSFFLFREKLPAAEGPDLLDGEELKSADPGVATLIPALAAEFDRLQLVARSRMPVLLRGESGTGKELLAAAVHRISGRQGNFQAVNCGAIAPDLIESELFGHRRGAFTGAVDDHTGLVRAADRGTLLLDEIGDLPLAAQAALLRVLQEEEVHPVGAPRPLKIDLRVVAATHRDLDALVSQERFRADLLARLSGYACTLPPLRERREDFPLFVAALLSKTGAPASALSPDAARALLKYSWPLNIRELEKALLAAAVLSRGARIELEHLPEAVRSPPVSPPARLDGEDQKRRDELIALLREHGGNVTAVARAMGKARSQVQRWLRKYRIDPLMYHR